jgi:small subunit ribosomal protein S8e
MAKWFLKSKKKLTGGKVNKFRKKKRFQRGRDYNPTILGKERKKTKRGLGGTEKRILVSNDTVNVAINGKVQKAKILEVLDNPADIHFVRRNILSKGAIIKTELGKAVVTSRPGQDGVLNAKLLEEPKE